MSTTSTRSRITRLAAMAESGPDCGATAFLSDGLGFAVVQASAGSWHAIWPGEYGAPAPASMLDLHPSEGVAPDAVLEALHFDADDESALGVLRQRPEEREVATGGNGRGFGARLAGTGARIGLRDPNGVQAWCATAWPRVDGDLPPAPARPRRLGHDNLIVTDPGRPPSSSPRSSP